MKLNKHIRSLKPSATLAINTKVNNLNTRGENIYHFGFGQSPFPIYNSIVKELQKNAENNNYLPTLGLEKLRNQIAVFLKNHQNLKVEKDLVFIGPGSKELLFQTILILDSTFLIPKGSWVSYGPQIQSKGVNYELLETFLQNDFKLTAKELDFYCKQNRKVKQKALILNSPNNPTGAVYSIKELKEIAKVCKENDIVVLSDEIYSQLNFTNTYSPSIATFYPERTIVFGGLSKVFSAGGYRLGYMALPYGLKDLKDTYKSLFSETFSAVASPIQFAAIKAFKMDLKLQKYISIQREILKGVSSYLSLEFTKLNVECTKPEGAFYMTISFEEYKSKIHSLGINTSKELSDYILNNYKVALLPGSDFYFKEEDFFFRLAFVDFNGREVLKSFKKSKKITKEFIKRECSNIYEGMEQIKTFVKSL